MPPGVVNVVPTTRAADVVGTWLQDPRVRKLSFTGSTAVGRRAAARRAPTACCNTSMELGGNAPFVVLPDADLDAAVAGAMVAKFRGGGQACTAANRFYVHESVREPFLALLGARVERLCVGRGSDPATDVGPLISRRAVDGARARRRRRTGQGRPCRRPGGAARPARLVPRTGAADGRPAGRAGRAGGGVRPRRPRRHLGATRTRCSSRSTAASSASRRTSGRATSAARCALAERIDAGMVGVNRGLVSDPSAPFGGVKQSGLGREGAREGLAAYQETQYLSVDWS